MRAHVYTYTTHTQSAYAMKSPDCNILVWQTQPKMLSSALRSWHPSRVDRWPRESKFIVRENRVQFSILHAISCIYLFSWKVSRAREKCWKWRLDAFPWLPSTYSVPIWYCQNPAHTATRFAWHALFLNSCYAVLLQDVIKSKLEVQVWCGSGDVGAESPQVGWRKSCSFTATFLYNYRLQRHKYKICGVTYVLCAVCEVVTVGKPDKGILGNNIPEKKPSFLSLWLHGGCIDNKSRSERSIQLKTEGLSW